jgi:hypothetical protein
LNALGSFGKNRPRPEWAHARTEHGADPRHQNDVLFFMVSPHGVTLPSLEGSRHMNKPLIVSLSVFMSAGLAASAVAADLIDAPGPGYRQQIERAFPAIKKVSPMIRVGAPVSYSIRTSNFPDPQLSNPFSPAPLKLDSNDSTLSLSPSTLRAFAAPIRLSIGDSFRPSTD